MAIIFSYLHGESFHHSGKVNDENNVSDFGTLCTKTFTCCSGQLKPCIMQWIINNNFGVSKIMVNLIGACYASIIVLIVLLGAYYKSNWINNF